MRSFYFWSKCGMNAKLYEEESVEILKIYGIIGNIE